MDCANHSGVGSTAFCQNCGKPLCQACVRSASGGQIFCEPCMTAWQSAQHPFVAPPMGEPNPVAAAALGIIPGVGAMYNGQFIKGFVHVFVFAVLVTLAGHHGIFGLFIPAWIIYQSFEAYHVARARRDGTPLPDPLGLNEVNSWFYPAGRAHHPGQPGSAPGTAGSAPGFGATASGTTGPVVAGTGAAGTGPANPYRAPFQNPYPPPGAYQSAQWQTPYQGPGGSAGPAGTDPSAGGPGYPPMPPVPPMHWRRPEPIGAVILIALGVLFLLNRIDWLSGRVFEYSWPLVLIGLGVWMIVRRMGDVRGGQK
jgi:TM2 domain-containing membrane protein YozV